MLGIEAASRARKITIFYQKVKGQKGFNHAFLPEDIQIEDLTQASCAMPSESARSAR